MHCVHTISFRATISLKMDIRVIPSVPPRMMGDKKITYTLLSVDADGKLEVMKCIEYVGVLTNKKHRLHLSVIINDETPALAFRCLGEPFENFSGGWLATHVNDDYFPRSEQLEIFKGSAILALGLLGGLHNYATGAKDPKTFTDIIKDLPKMESDMPFRDDADNDLFHELVEEALSYIEKYQEDHKLKDIASAAFKLMKEIFSLVHPIDDHSERPIESRVDRSIRCSYGGRVEQVEGIDISRIHSYASRLPNPPARALRSEREVDASCTTDGVDKIPQLVHGWMFVNQITGKTHPIVTGIKLHLDSDTVLMVSKS